MVLYHNLYISHFIYKNLFYINKNISNSKNISIFYFIYWVELLIEPRGSLYSRVCVTMFVYHEIEILIMSTKIKKIKKSLYKNLNNVYS